MKTVANITCRLSNNTFGYDKAGFTEIYFDNSLFSNAAELVIIEDDFRIQPTVCEACGINGCNVDGYYKIRKLSDNALFIAQDSKSFYMMNDAQFEMLKKFFHALPSLEMTPCVTAHEMLYLLPPTPLLEIHSDKIIFNKKLVLTTNTDNDQEIYQILQYELDQMFNNDNLITLHSTQQAHITLFLDSFTVDEWQPLVKIDNQYFIYLGSGYFIKMSK